MWGKRATQPLPHNQYAVHKISFFKPFLASKTYMIRTDSISTCTAAWRGLLRYKQGLRFHFIYALHNMFDIPQPHYPATASPISRAICAPKRGVKALLYGAGDPRDTSAGKLCAADTPDTLEQVSGDVHFSSFETTGTPESAIIKCSVPVIEKKNLKGEDKYHRDNYGLKITTGAKHYIDSISWSFRFVD